MNSINSEDNSIAPNITALVSQFNTTEGEVDILGDINSSIHLNCSRHASITKTRQNSQSSVAERSIHASINN